MKKFLKSKKLLISLTIVLLLTILIVGVILLFRKDKKANSEPTTKNYVAYVKINPSIKLEYSQSCDSNKCDDPIVTKYELLNEDAKDIFKDIDLLQNDKSFIGVIKTITAEITNHNISFKVVDIYSNWTKIDEYFNNVENNDWNINTIIKGDNDLKELEQLLIEDKIFNTDEENNTDNQENKLLANDFSGIWETNDGSTTYYFDCGNEYVWMHSFVADGHETRYATCGTYTINGNKIILNDKILREEEKIKEIHFLQNEKGEIDKNTICVINGDCFNRSSFSSCEELGERTRIYNH